MWLSGSGVRERGCAAGTKLTPSGSITVMRPGTVINGSERDRLDQREANNVTIQNTKVS